MHLYALLPRMVDPSSDTVTVWIRLMSVSQALLGRVEEALKAAGLPPLSWYDALLEIERAGDSGIRPFELKDRLLLPQYGASRLLDRMEKAGLIARSACEGDARGQVVMINASGRRARRRMWPIYAGQLAELIEGRLDATDRAQLSELLAKLAAAKGEGETEDRA